MELTIKLENEKLYYKVMQFLKSLNVKIVSVTNKKKRKEKPDEITLLSEKSLAEEWNSKEDKAWDKIL